MGRDYSLNGFPWPNDILVVGVTEPIPLFWGGLLSVSVNISGLKILH